MAAPKPEKSSNIPPNVHIKENLYAMSARFEEEKEKSLSDIPLDAYKDVDSKIAIAISMDEYPEYIILKQMGRSRCGLRKWGERR